MAAKGNQAAKRKVNFTRFERDMLFLAAEDHIEVDRSKYSNTRTSDAWSSIAAAVNKVDDCCDSRSVEEVKFSAQRREAKRAGGPQPTPQPPPIGDPSRRIVKLLTKGPNFMGTDEEVETPIFDEVSTFTRRAATSVSASPSAAWEVEPPVSAAITDHRYDDTTANRTSVSYRPKWKKVSQENVWDLQWRVLKAQKEKLLEEKEKIVLEKEKFVVETEKLQMEKERIAMEKEKLRLEKVKLEFEVSLLHASQLRLLPSSVMSRNNGQQ
uniref:Uncharacterized protein n=1 Tax=Eptatretus burgeri TaxID=7764 RepID=A0A8C4Q8S1_EPTBU